MNNDQNPEIMAGKARADAEIANWITVNLPIELVCSDPVPPCSKGRRRRARGLFEYSGGEWTLTQPARAAGYRLTRECSLWERLGFALRVVRYGHWRAAWAIVGGK